jgi:hypothetical protein
MMRRPSQAAGLNGWVRVPLIVTGISLALSEKALYIAIALPYALTAVFFFMLQKYIEERCGGGSAYI